jgi:phosphatidylglycerol lysyltransferase
VSGKTDDTVGSRESAVAIERLQQFGSDAVSFQALESGMRWWRDADPPVGTGAALGFTDTGRAWIAAGAPLALPAHRHHAAQRFAADARAARRRAIFVGVEDVAPFRDFHHLTIGRQSALLPQQWSATLAAKPRLREQLRRARAKRVTVRRVSTEELREGTVLRRDVDALARTWLGSRRMEPMGFLVSVEPFHLPDAHIYLIAERDARVVQFLSAVPIYADRGWLMEDMLRGPDAPNGTTELLIDRLMHEAADARRITPGLTPLSGPIPWWLRVTRTVMRPLYDFSGLERFRSRLSPARWDPIWLVWDRGPALLALLDLLTAFARGALVRFAARSIVRHPSGPPWALALPLVPWTVLLAVLSVAGRADLLGFSTAVLAGWVAFDAVLAFLLMRAAMTPTRGRIGAALAWASLDAVLSIAHLGRVGLAGAGIAGDALRLVATLAPVAGSAALFWAWRQTRSGRV